MIRLTDDQHRELAEGGTPSRVFDPKTNAEYVLIPAEQYDLMQRVIETNEDPEAFYPLLADLAPEDWEDPAVYGLPPKS